MGLRELIEAALHEEINAAYARVQNRFGVAGDVDPGAFGELNYVEGALVDVAARWIGSAVGGDDGLHPGDAVMDGFKSLLGDRVSPDRFGIEPDGSLEGFDCDGAIVVQVFHWSSVGAARWLVHEPDKGFVYDGPDVDAAVSVAAGCWDGS